MYQKLIRTCKYFFYKNPITVCSRLKFSANSSASQIKVHKNGEKKLIDLNIISQRFWITRLVNVDSKEIVGKENVMSSLIPHIYRCDAVSLYLSYQHIAWNEYLFLAANAQFVGFKKIAVTNESGSIVPVEKLIEVAVNVTHFRVVFHENDQSVSSKTVQNLLQYHHFATLNDFDLGCIPESFDIDTFFAYIKKNNHTHFRLRFSEHISDAYKNQLESIVDEIIDAERHDYQVPMITFDGLNDEKHKKLRDIFCLSLYGIE